MSRYYDDYPAYVSVGERKRQIKQKIAKLRKQGKKLSPVEIEGRLIARTFWGEAWCTNIESYHDYSNRLPRARSYVKHGAVVDLKIKTGKITALVQGSELYNVDITIEKLDPERWERIKQECAGKINSLIDLIQGKLSDEVIALLCRHDEGLFPAPNEIRLDCDCPDWADLCKHLAAVLYGIGARLDHEPELFFLLRGVDQNELFTADLTDNLTGTETDSAIADDALGDIFGIDLDDLDDIIAEPVPKKQATKKKKRAVKTKSTKPTPKVKKEKTTTQNRLKKQTNKTKTTKVKPSPTPKVTKQSKTVKNTIKKSSNKSKPNITKGETVKGKIASKSKQAKRSMRKKKE